MLLCSTIYVLVAIQSVNGWDLSGLEHRGYYYNNYAIEHVSIYYVRAFLCLKTNFTASRSKCPSSTGIFGMLLYVFSCVIFQFNHR